jgi:FMN phosphatase YigB (HAD superfamily)
MIRFRALLLGVLLVLVASACRVEATVDVAVDDDGSGVVTVTVVADAAAVELVPDFPDDIRFDGLEDAGWTVEDPVIGGAGSMTVVVSKPFAEADALPGVLTELAGEGVVFADVQLLREDDFAMVGLSPATTEYRLTGTVDPGPDLQLLGAAVLSPPLGRSVDEIVAASGTPLEDALGLLVAVSMPGDVTVPDSAAGAPDVDGDTATWVFSYGDEPVDLDASASVEDILPRVWAIVALLAALALALVLLSRLGARLLARWRTPKNRRPREVRRRQQRAASREAEANRPRSRLLRLLVVDVHGVVVRPTDPLEGLLLPLVTGEQPDLDPETVRDRHRKLVLGRLSPEEFWSELGLGPVAEEIETRYLSSFRLVPGLHPFLDRMKTSRLPVAAIGNQPAVWGERLRRMAALDGVVASWLVSGDVGAALPEPSLFEATRRTNAVDLYDCFYLSSVESHLDAAQELGMATAFFAPDPEDVVPSEHTVVRGFEELLR